MNYQSKVLLATMAIIQPLFVNSKEYSLLLFQFDFLARKSYRISQPEIIAETVSVKLKKYKNETSDDYYTGISFVYPWNLYCATIL